MLTLAEIISAWMAENKTTHKLYYRRDFMVLNNRPIEYDVIACSCLENSRHVFVHIYDDRISSYSVPWSSHTASQTVHATDKDFFYKLADILRHTCD